MQSKHRALVGIWFALAALIVGLAFALGPESAGFVVAIAFPLLIGVSITSIGLVVEGQKPRGADAADG
jgi:uncharacterized membrane protein